MKVCDERKKRFKVLEDLDYGAVFSFPKSQSFYMKTDKGNTYEGNYFSFCVDIESGIVKEFDVDTEVEVFEAKVVLT